MVIVDCAEFLLVQSWRKSASKIFLVSWGLPRRIKMTKSSVRRHSIFAAFFTFSLDLVFVKTPSGFVTSTMLRLSVSPISNDKHLGVFLRRKHYITTWDFYQKPFIRRAVGNFIRGWNLKGGQNGWLLENDILLLFHFDSKLFCKGLCLYLWHNIWVL